MARQLGQHHSVLPIPVGDPQGDLHHQRDRVAEHGDDDAALKALFLAIREAAKNWKAIHHWKPALQSFQLMFGEDRVPLAVL